MGKRGRRIGASSAGCASSACSASDECPYRVWKSGGDGSLSSGFGLGSGSGLGAGAGVGAGAADASGVGASRAAAVVESARVDHFDKRERGRVELASASGVDAAENETTRTRAVRRRREEGQLSVSRRERHSGAALWRCSPLRLSLLSLGRSQDSQRPTHPQLLRIRFMTLSVSFLSSFACMPCSGSSQAGFL
jgi:hypothetical protein